MAYSNGKTNGNGKKKKSTSSNTRTRQKSVIDSSKAGRKKAAPKKKKVYFTGSKAGKPTFGSKPNPNIIGSIGAKPARKRKTKMKKK